MSGIIDCEMHIGDEVFVHGYIDEIRNDTIIIRNVGGYFGTSRDEVFYYEEDDRGYGTMNEADRKTEPQREECKNCKEGQEDCYGCPFVKPKDEPHIAGKHADVIIIDDPQAVEPNLILPERMERGEMYEVGDTIVVMNSQDYYDLLCKSWADEPQTDCDGCQHYADKHTADACYECRRSYTDGYVPQTERSSE